MYTASRSGSSSARPVFVVFSRSDLQSGVGEVNCDLLDSPNSMPDVLALAPEVTDRHRSGNAILQNHELDDPTGIVELFGADGRVDKKFLHFSLLKTTQSRDTCWDSLFKIPKVILGRI